MPKPPMLDTVDWNAVHKSGLDFETWLGIGESEKNVETMRKIHSTQELSDGARARIKAISKPVNIVAISEDWCGDVVRHAPVLQRIADESDLINVRYVRRDSHDGMFIRFLTNGGEAIPKFIFLSDAFVECGNWGPMTQAFRDLISKGKACGDVGSARKIIHDAYFADTSRADVVDELLDFIEIAGATSVSE
jgi:hypothetical protein